MKLFGDTEPDKPYYDHHNNLSSFSAALSLLFQLVNGQGIYTIAYDMREHGVYTPFIYFASFFFLIVFICTNLLVVTVLDNFANLATMDDDCFEPEELDEFGTSWRRVTFDEIWDVDPNEVDIEITELMIASMPEDELVSLFEEKVRREEKIRLRNWARFRNKFAKKDYLPDSYFSGWIHQPNVISKLTQGIVAVRDSHYFWCRP
jgi:hypothetical protein